MDKKIYCIEIITLDSVLCRFTLSSFAYNMLMSLTNDADKVEYINDYFDNIHVIKFVKQFTTYNDEIMIGCLSGEIADDF